MHDSLVPNEECPDPPPPSDLFVLDKEAAQFPEGGLPAFSAQHIRLVRTAPTAIPRSKSTTDSLALVAAQTFELAMVFYNATINAVRYLSMVCQARHMLELSGNHGVLH